MKPNKKARMMMKKVRKRRRYREDLVLEVVVFLLFDALAGLRVEDQQTQHLRGEGWGKVNLGVTLPVRKREHGVVAELNAAHLHQRLLTRDALLDVVAGRIVAQDQICKRDLAIMQTSKIMNRETAKGDDERGARRRTLLGGELSLKVDGFGHFEYVLGHAGVGSKGLMLLQEDQVVDVEGDEEGDEGENGYRLVGTEALHEIANLSHCLEVVSFLKK